jgi:vanillate O-demethylase monooxygenase subunit
MIAAALRITPRHLHRLFSGEDGTVGRYILRRRLEECAGTVTALSSKCCHRRAPLSLGRKEGDCVRCMYHGLKYDANGICVEIPGQQAIPSGIRVRAYPVIEQKRWIWIWMGDPSKVDRTTLPDTFSLQDPGWRMKPGYLHYAANHRLISDNLLDFSHLSYVHERSLGGTPQIAGTRANMERLPRGVRLTRRVLNTVPVLHAGACLCAG